MKNILLFIILIIFISYPNYTQAQNESEFSNSVISIGVVVKDLEKSLDFYIQVLGMQKTGSFDLDEDFAKRSGLSGGVPFHVEVLKLVDSPQATQWKLMSFKEKVKFKKPKHIQDDIGMQYITVFVNSLQPFIERLKQHKIKLLGDTPTPLDNERHFILIQDPNGIFIELIGSLE